MAQDSEVCVALHHPDEVRQGLALGDRRALDFVNGDDSSTEALHGRAKRACCASTGLIEDGPKNLLQQ